MKLEKTVYPLALEMILTFCADYFDTDKELVKSKVRRREIVMIRHFSRYLSRKYLDGYYSLAVIGSITRCDHATVLHSDRAVVNAIETEGKKPNTWGCSFKEAEIVFVEERLKDITKVARGGQQKKILDSRNLIYRQERKLSQKDKVISSMYNEFLKLSKEIVECIDNDNLMTEGYLKRKAKDYVNSRKATLRSLKLGASNL